jgi:hypothetical protein
MTKVLIAVDETEESIEAGALAHRLFGDDAEYLAINVFEHPPPSQLPDPGWTTPSGVRFDRSGQTRRRPRADRQITRCVAP